MPINYIHRRREMTSLSFLEFVFVPLSGSEPRFPRHNKRWAVSATIWPLTGAQGSSDRDQTEV